MDQVTDTIKPNEAAPASHSTKEKKSLSQQLTSIKKKWWIVGAVVLIFIGLLFAIFQSTDEKQKKELASQESKNASAAQQATKDDGSFNPLINKKDLETVRAIQRKQFQDAGKPIPPDPTYNFQYEVSDKVKGKSSFLQVQQTYAASACNIASLPKTVSVYTLKSHMVLAEAKDLAKQFQMTSDPASVPSPDNGSYQYYFTDASVSKYLSISEPALVYNYHHALDDVATTTNITQSQAKTLADKAMTTYKLLSDTTATAQPLDNGYYNVNYRKTYSNLTLVDQNSVDALGGGSPCSVKPALEMGTAEVVITQKGSLNKLINRTREVVKLYSLSLESLDQSVVEYGDKPPILPKVTGNVSPTDKVIIDEVALVYYDYGEAYPQVSYVPMYLTKGKTANGASVVTLLPAVSQTELATTPIAGLVNRQESLQLETFNPPPPPAIEKIASSSPGPLGNTCSGGIVHTTVICNAPSGSRVCKLNVDVPQDPYGSCTKGCVDASEVITVAAGQNACAELLKQKGISGSSKSSSKMGDPGSGSSIEAGSLSCKISACPC